MMKNSRLLVVLLLNVTASSFLTTGFLPRSCTTRQRPRAAVSLFAETGGGGEAREGVLLDRLGGEPALRAAVDEFYVRVVSDEALAPFFVDTDMEHLKHHQYKFMELAFTGVPDGMDVGAMIAAKHRPSFDKGMNERHFDLVAGHLVATLQHLGIEQPIIDEVVGVVGPLRAVFEEKAHA